MDVQRAANSWMSNGVGEDKGEVDIVEVVTR